MAREYEVREEFVNYGLAQLMDASVLCFQGVGDIQSELLKSYFNISTVRDLANWTPFLWSLEIQELALHGGDLAHTPIRQIAQTTQPKFQVRERGADLTPEQLMHAGVQDLEGITPAQDLALYDIFRITNVAQLAHNRIMLEARVIQYLEGQSASAAPAEAAHDGVDHVLGRGTTAGGVAAQRVTEARKASRDERLHAMESETREHVQERLAAVRERARSRAATLTTGAQASRPEVMAGVQRGVSSDRLASISSRRTTVASGVSRDRGALDAGRMLGRAGGATAAVAGRGLAAREGVAASGAGSSRTAAVLAARGGHGAGGGTVAGRPSGGGGGGSASYVGRSGGGGGGGSATVRASPATGAAGAAAPAAPAAPAQPAPSTQTRRSGGFPPILIAAAVVVVALIVIVYFALRPSTQPMPGQPTTAQQGTAVQPGGSATAPGAGTAPGVGTAPGSATAPGKATATGQAGVKGPTSAPGSAKTIHTVRWGQSLWRISRRYYDVGHDWPIIYKENQDQIDEPDLIYPDQQFRIPPKP